MYRSLALSCFTVALTALVGCGPGGPSLNKVTGTVTLDGAPLPGATVTLQPLAGGTGKPATGIADANGAYTVTDMTSKNIGGGAAVGDYQVSVLWYKPSKDSSQATGADGGEDKSVGNDKSSASKVSGPDTLLPAAYQNPATSGIIFSVVKGTNPPFDIKLDSKFKGAN